MSGFWIQNRIDIFKPNLVHSISRFFFFSFNSNTFWLNAWFEQLSKKSPLLNFLSLISNHWFLISVLTYKQSEAITKRSKDLQDKLLIIKQNLTKGACNSNAQARYKPYISRKSTHCIISKKGCNMRQLTIQQSVHGMVNVKSE